MILYHGSNVEVKEWINSFQTISFAARLLDVI